MAGMRQKAAFFARWAGKNWSMKKFVFAVLVLVLVGVVAVLLPKEKEYDYLRIHIRANSNLAVDQNVKYMVKDEVVKFLTPKLCNVPSKAEAIEIVEKNTAAMESICQNTLNKNGFFYSAHVKINNEYFPTRTYNNTTLQSGYYDAVIVELGSAQGDNWWCVMYPPLCFVGENDGSTSITFKSKIAEWFKKLFS